jgi:hypothetical protein
MAAYNKFNSFVEALAEGVHDLGSDDLRVVLTNSAPSAGNTVLSDITQIANGNGYTTGGEAATQVSSSQTGGTYKLVLNDVTWTATGAMGPFRYVVLYNADAANDELIGWWDYGSSITPQSGDTFTVDFDGSNGVLTIA